MSTESIVSSQEGDNEKTDHNNLAIQAHDDDVDSETNSKSSIDEVSILNS